MAVLRVCVSALLLMVLAPICDCILTLDLNGNWTLLNAKSGLNMSATVPGSMYTDLLANKAIPNPLYRDNDVMLTWIGREDWTYARSFHVREEFSNAGAIILICDGLDTFSNISINDNHVGISENMFVQYVYNIKPFLRVGENTIVVQFRSAVFEALERVKDSAYIIQPVCPPLVQHGECHVNQIRKAQCSFSWDWGPSFPTQGIWKNIYIEAYETAVIRDLSVAPTLDSDGSWTLHISVHFDVHGHVKGTLNTDIIGTMFTAPATVSLSPENNHFKYSLTFPKNLRLNRWWPNGYGEQNLYTVNVTFVGSHETNWKSRKVGFRTVELVQDPIGQGIGLSFYFKVNDVPIFFKGSNWIPADSFQETITKEIVYRLLKSAVVVHINCLRVWGGGVYESDMFYDIADELGIMIWQDFMFSVALYPTTPNFLNTVTQEVTHQVRRLRHHPSIVLWNGNNENEEGLTRNWFNTYDNYQRYYDDYVMLYVTTIMRIVAREDPTRTYLTSSPSNGKRTKDEGWTSQDTYSELYGDVHYYDFQADLWKDSIFRVPRFASEYGIQSWCGRESLEDVFSPEDFDYWGPMTRHRNHRGPGEVQMLDEILDHFHKPVNMSSSQMFTDLIYLTQIYQAMSMKAETEHYRRWQNRLTTDGRGQTMGALYWQFNDIWTAPSWSGIDYKGKWKMLHYYARHFFSPVLISPYLEGTTLNVYIIVDEIAIKEDNGSTNGVKVFRPYEGYPDLLKSDFAPNRMVELMTRTQEVVRGTLFIDMYRWDNFTVQHTWSVRYMLKLTSQLVFTKGVYSLLSDAHCPNIISCFLHMYVNDRSSGITASFPLAYYNSIEGLAKARITITNVTKNSDTEFTIAIESNRIAPFVWLDVYRVSGYFSDNGFLMVLPSKVVTFTSWEPVDLDIIKHNLTVKSLMDVEFDMEDR